MCINVNILAISTGFKKRGDLIQSKQDVKKKRVNFQSYRLNADHLDMGEYGK